MNEKEVQNEKGEYVKKNTRKFRRTAKLETKAEEILKRKNQERRKKMEKFNKNVGKRERREKEIEGK